MSKSKKPVDIASLDPATLAKLKLHTRTRFLIARALLKRRRRKSNQ